MQIGNRVVMLDECLPSRALGQVLRADADARLHAAHARLAVVRAVLFEAMRSSKSPQDSAKALAPSR